MLILNVSTIYRSLTSGKQQRMPVQSLDVGMALNVFDGSRRWNPGEYPPITYTYISRKQKSSAYILPLIVWVYLCSNVSDGLPISFYRAMLRRASFQRYCRVFVLLTPLLFHPILGVFRLVQISLVEVSLSPYLKLFNREIIFEVFQVMRSRYLTSQTDSDGQKDRQTDRQTDDLL